MSSVLTYSLGSQVPASRAIEATCLSQESKSLSGVETPRRMRVSQRTTAATVAMSSGSVRASRKVIGVSAVGTNEP